MFYTIAWMPPDKLVTSRRKGQELICWGQSESEQPKPNVQVGVGHSTGSNGRNTGSLSKQDKKTHILGSWSRDRGASRGPQACLAISAAL